MNLFLSLLFEFCCFFGCLSGVFGFNSGAAFRFLEKAKSRRANAQPADV